MKHFYSLFLLLSAFCLNSFAQDNQSPYKLTFIGFLRADAILDSRQAVEAREGFLLFYPKQPLLDPNGKDINAQPSFNQYAMCSRVGAKLTGFEVLGSKATAFIEGDFTGASNAENNSMRLRHAYLALQWTKSRLLVGQYWHPLDLPEMIPYVLALNTGAPFHSFSRQPQIRFEHILGKINLIAVASSQRDYVNNGPAGNSSAYLRNSVVPNLDFLVMYKTGKSIIGGGIDYKQLKPRLVTDSGYVSNEKVNCFSATAFYKTEINNLVIKTQYTLNRGLNDHLMMGGYGVTGIDQLNDQRSYAPLTYHAVWLNVAYNRYAWQPSFFAGYTIDKTDDENLIPNLIYARDPEIEYVYRLSPMVTYVRDKFNFCCELEYTVAARNDSAKRPFAEKSKETGMLRINLAAVYFF